MYRSAAIIRIDESGSVGKGRADLDRKAIEAVLSSDITQITAETLKNLYKNSSGIQFQDKLFLLNGSAQDATTVSEIEQSISNGESITIFSAPRPPGLGGNLPPGHGGDKPGKGSGNTDEPATPISSGRDYTTSILQDTLIHGKDINLLYGVKLLEEANNDYQEATLDVRFDVLLEQKN